MDNVTTETIWKVALLVTLLGASWGVYLGLMGKAVFYMNEGDLFMSFSGWIVMLASALIAFVLHWDWVFYVGCVIAAMIVVRTTYMAYLYNMKNLSYAIPVGLAKILLGLVYVLTWLQAIDPGGKTASERRENRITAFIIIGLITPLLYKLVNGREVYAKNGWPLPRE